MEYLVPADLAEAARMKADGATVLAGGTDVYPAHVGRPLEGAVVDKTPAVDAAERGDEIAAWLAEHPVAGCVIIDDHLDMGALRSRLVLTHPAHGLRPADAERAIALVMAPFRGVSPP